MIIGIGPVDPRKGEIARMLPHILGCHTIVKTDITIAEGVCLFDSQGRRYVDFESGIWCTALGHCNSRVNRAMTDQLNKGIHLNTRLTTYLAEELATQLLTHFHWSDGKAVFLSSGSEAVELGVTIAQLATKRNSVLSFFESYLAAFGQSGNFHTDRAWIKLDFSNCAGCPEDECTASCPLLRPVVFETISAFVLEPGSTHGRIVFPPRKLVAALARETQAAGGLVVVDEVTTGLGRTGEWFGYNHYGIKPDIVALGKSLGNGYPVSAVLMDKEIAVKVESSQFYYAQSHQNDPLGCAVAREVIRIIEEDNMVNRSRVVGNMFLAELRKIGQSLPVVKDIRGRGLMIGVELHKGDIVEEISARMLERGYFIGVTPAANVLRFHPPLTIDEGDIMAMCSALEDVLRSY